MLRNKFLRCRSSFCAAGFWYLLLMLGALFPAHQLFPIGQLFPAGQLFAQEEAPLHRPIEYQLGSIASRNAGHWGQAGVGFDRTELGDSEARRSNIDTGPFFFGTITYPVPEGTAGYPVPNGPDIHAVLKGLAIRLGENGQGGLLFDTELLQYRVGWVDGFLGFQAPYIGLIVHPHVEGKTLFRSQPSPGWSRNGSLVDPRPPLAKVPTVKLGSLPKDWGRYQGIYVHGERVVIEYQVSDVRVRESPWLVSTSTGVVFTRTVQVSPTPHPLQLRLGDLGQTFARILPANGTHSAVTLRSTPEGLLAEIPASEQPQTFVIAFTGAAGNSEQTLADLPPGSWSDDLANLVEPGEVFWKELVTTQGQLGEGSGAYVSDTVTLPFDNPYHSLMFVSAHAFFANGDAAIATVYGDVWIVKGLDADLDQLTWKRFAAGLFQPLGMQIIDGKIYVACRDQIAILHDRNHDEDVDYIQNFSHDGLVTWNPHEFVTNLERDSQGNFYVIKSDTAGITEHDGCVLKITPDGSQLSVFATGFRNSNSLTVAPDDRVFVSPQEGDWTPGSAIFVAQEGGFHGHLGAHHASTPPTTYVRPLCWIPRLADNSSGGHVWANSKQWGPLQDKLIHLSAGQCRMFVTLEEKCDHVLQGGVVPLDLDFPSCLMRGRFHPLDQQLYVSGMRSWVSRATQDGCFQRIRYTGQPVYLPNRVHTYANGLAITFHQPLDQAAVEHPDAYRIRRWNYQWSNQYGSLHYRLPPRRALEAAAAGEQTPAETAQQPPDASLGEDEVEILSARLLDDAKTVFLEIADMRPANQWAIDLGIRAADKTPIRQQVYYTVHRVPAQRMEVPSTTAPSPGRSIRRDDPRLSPGLLVRPLGTDDSGTPRQIRVHRLATWPQARGNRLAVEGFIDVPAPGRYRFRIQSEGHARLMVQGTSAANGQEIDLNAGLNSLEMVYEPAIPPAPAAAAANHQGDLPAFRVLWQSDLFAEEPLPPTALFHLHDQSELARQDQIHRGRDLFARLQCQNCHGEQPRAVDPTWQAPDLVATSSRFNPTWLATWLVGPSSLHPDARMPDVVHGEGELAEQTAWDLVAYLSEAQRADTPGASAVVAAVTGSAEHGAILYEDLGCIGCHTFAAPNIEHAAHDDEHRISLFDVSHKYRPGALQAFLRDPRQHFASNRMPDFRLSAPEAADLEEYLRANTQDAPLPNGVKQRPGDAKRGKEKFQELKCQQCHIAPEATSGTLSAPYRSAVVPNVDADAQGCLATDAEQSVRYSLHDDERLALMAYLANRDTLDLLNHNDPVQLLDRTTQLVRQLRCTACHDLDHQRARLPGVLSEEGTRGLAPESFPSLTWAGEKLHETWLVKFIAGEINEPQRPWLKGRMPSFPHFAPTLAQGLRTHHGITTETDDLIIDAQLVEVGQRLASEQGFHCLQCHSAQLRPQDNQGNIAPAIPFAKVRARLRHEYYQRFVLDPSRFDLNTKMPKLSLDGKTTSLRSIYGGDAARQFEALWHFIQRGGGE